MNRRLKPVLVLVTVTLVGSWVSGAFDVSAWGR